MYFLRYRSILSISVVGLSLVLVSGCKFLIPEDTNAPRYNTVLGTKRQPEKNRGYEQAPTSNVRPQSQATPPAMPSSPPPQQGSYQSSYTPTSQSYAQTSTQTESAGQPGFWDRMAFWNSDEANANNAANATLRHVPEENTQLANAAASPTSYTPMPAAAPPAAGYPTYDSRGYPQLSSVPARPDSEAARLDAVRAQLEQDRAAAAQSSANLSAAAAAEPSLAPMPEPVAVSNLPPPPQPVMAPQPAYQMAPQPAPSYQMTPATSMTSYQAPPPAPGGYNPMAGSSAYGTGYLPDSRYAPMRTQ